MSVFSLKSGRKETQHVVTITKNEVKHALQLEYCDKLHILRERVRLFEKKYGRDLDAFQKIVAGRTEESFQEWDDYLEWKGYAQALAETEEKIEEIEREHFVVA